MRLVKPSIKFKNSYIALVNEFIEHDEPLVPFVLNENYHDFSAMVNRLNNYAKGIAISDAFVPHATYWLVNQSDELLGVVNLRFKLTPRLRQIGGNIGFGIKPSQRKKGHGTLILKYALLKIKKAGLIEARVTCNKSNPASRAVIQANNGILESEEYMKDLGDVVQRFRIEV